MSDTRINFWRHSRIGWLLLTCIALTSCAAATKPIIFPNDHFNKVGHVQADVDRSYCMTLADNFVKDPNKYEAMAKSGALGGVVGAGSGAVAGAIMGGSVGRAVAAGAAVGAIVSITGELIRSNQHTPSYERFVEQCLHNKGYQVTGWQ